ncbi:hypothetical protein KQX54_007754 [Cotesia glomerata]|uniref:Uncharacterized protein n=1 Tax=Cotesia glomerata TaxID=32391 RepID=A0AAV7I031_COTGL|nr:hypothetical protein KQX54_007754 [Cotesia glomerata]
MLHKNRPISTLLPLPFYPQRTRNETLNSVKPKQPTPDFRFSALSPSSSPSRCCTILMLTSKTKKLKLNSLTNKISSVKRARPTTQPRPKQKFWTNKRVVSGIGRRWVNKDRILKLERSSIRPSTKGCIRCIRKKKKQSEDSVERTYWTCTFSTLEDLQITCGRIELADVERTRTEDEGVRTPVYVRSKVYGVV